MIESETNNDSANEIRLQKKPPVEEPPNRPEKPPVEEPEDPPEPPPPPAEPPVKKPPNEPEKPPVKEPPPEDPDREPPRKPPIRACHRVQGAHSRYSEFWLCRKLKRGTQNHEGARKDKSKIMCFPFVIFVFFVVRTISNDLTGVSQITAF
ncbi:MAG: hypothetical protein P8185_06960 [Deltaproteobacteria bacterium]|jgi:hypothetical protein